MLSGIHTGFLRRVLTFRDLPSKVLISDNSRVRKEYFLNCMLTQTVRSVELERNLCGLQNFACIRMRVFSDDIWTIAQTVPQANGVR